MKKVLLIAVLLCVSFFGTVAQSWRPYNHWKFTFIRGDNVETAYINLYELDDAIAKFRADCPTCEIRAVARDFYITCNQR